jgi:hypothetical protein
MGSVGTCLVDMPGWHNPAYSASPILANGGSKFWRILMLLGFPGRYLIADSGHNVITESPPGICHCANRGRQPCAAELPSVGNSGRVEVRGMTQRFYL